MNLTARDCSPFDPQPTGAEVAWLRRLAAGLRISDFVIPVSGNRRNEDEPVIYCDWDGTWWAGRYVGSISFEGSLLTIRPRLGLAALKNWLFEATSVALIESPGVLKEDDTFIVQLLASVWAHGFVQAARHRLPTLRRETRITGPSIKGRIDVRSSLRLIKEGQIVSVRSERSLDHAASEAIVAAYSVLRRWIGIPDERWLPSRARELLPHLIAVTGPRPHVPTKAEIERIRYTPITIGFAPIAELSREIANRRGLTGNIDADGKTKGVLLDIAELWELYVVGVLRKAATAFTVKHGTRETEATKKLLRSDVNGDGLGLLIPDAIISMGGQVHGVLDAKYKRLEPTRHSPQGPQREDLYQMTAYLGQYGQSGYQQRWGILAYPRDVGQPTQPMAEILSPWSLEANKKVLFLTFPHDPTEAVDKMKMVLAKLQSMGVVEQRTIIFKDLLQSS